MVAAVKESKGRTSNSIYHLVFIYATSCLKVREVFGWIKGQMMANTDSGSSSPASQ